MLVAEAEPGQLIETIIFGQPTGNIYRIANMPVLADRIAAWDSYGHLRRLHGGNQCRVVAQ